MKEEPLAIRRDVAVVSVLMVDNQRCLQQKPKLMGRGTEAYHQSVPVVYFEEVRAATVRATGLEKALAQLAQLDAGTCCSSASA